jgi:N-methylhydantoinase A
MGGTDPTVTDALVQLGFIDPGGYLGGRLTLRPELAERALTENFGDAFGWSADVAAANVYELALVNMSNALREATVQQGHDPRDFVFLAYGGTLGVFAWETAARLGISKVVIPHNGSVFCARGLLWADHVVRRDQGVQWPLDSGEDVERVNGVIDKTLAAAREEMTAEGFSGDDLELARAAECRFQGQAYELTVALPDRPLAAEDGPVLAAQFRELYERTYGAGTAWEGVPTVMVNSSVTLTAPQPRPTMPLHDLAEGAEPTPNAQRDVYLPGGEGRTSVPVYREADFVPGARLTGPAIIDATDTTLYVPAGVTAERDALMNLVLTN